MKSYALVVDLCFHSIYNKVTLYLRNTELLPCITSYRSIFRVNEYSILCLKIKYITCSSMYCRVFHFGRILQSSQISNLKCSLYVYMYSSLRYVITCPKLMTDLQLCRMKLFEFLYIGVGQIINQDVTCEI